MKVTDKAELSYTAGIVDGEGCITIGKVKRQEGEDVKNQMRNTLLKRHVLF